MTCATPIFYRSLWYGFRQRVVLTSTARPSHDSLQRLANDSKAQQGHAPVVIIHGDQLAKAPVASEGAGLLGDALHHAAVAEGHIRVVVHHLGRVRLVEARSEMRLSRGQANGIADALAEWTCMALTSLA